MVRTEVIVALGSNIGNRCHNLALALSKMKEVGIKVVCHSALYETSPVGVLDQPDFLNSAVLSVTSDPPMTLLTKLKNIERSLGRDLDGGVRFGPRNIDLDIISYGNLSYQDETLTIPHPRWKERDFVKFPLRDLAGSYPYLHTMTPNKVDGFLDQVKSIPLEKNEELKKSIRQVLPFHDGKVKTLSATWMMKVLNITPDSFSEKTPFISHEGKTQTNEILEQAEKDMEDGIEILDIGGQSTRPGSTFLSPELEWQRVEPVIKLLMEKMGPKKPLLSIDTFHAKVAREGILAGMDIINDVSAGKIDPSMFDTVADLNVPYILMHMRGTPQTMLEAKNVEYSEDPVKQIGEELQNRALEAMEAGIPGWNIILDPGVGFSKPKEISFQLLKELGRLKNGILQGTCSKMPLLVGMSRKRFFELLIGERSPEERDIATGAMMVHCVQQGANILRVHNSHLAKDIISVADALYH